MFSKYKTGQLTSGIFREEEPVYLDIIWGRWVCVVSEGSQRHSKNTTQRVWANSGRWPVKSTAWHFWLSMAKENLLWTSHHFLCIGRFLYILYKYLGLNQDNLQRAAFHLFLFKWWVGDGRQVTCSGEVGDNVHLCEEHGFGCFFLTGRAVRICTVQRFFCCIA